MSKIDTSKLLNEFSINLLLKHNCIYNNFKITLYLQKLISDKNINKNITLKQHYELFNKKLTIVVTNITKNICEYISYKNYPNLQLWKAILMSISIPLVFPLVKYNNDEYVDGAVLNCLPIELIREKNYDKTIIISYEPTFVKSKNDEQIIDSTQSILKKEDIIQSSKIEIKNNIEFNNIISYIFNISKIYLSQINLQKKNKLIYFKNYYCYYYNFPNIKQFIYSFIDIKNTEEEIIKFINDGYNYIKNN